MSKQVTREILLKMVTAAECLIRENQTLLSELDSASGDGDHGTTMLRSINRLVRALGTNAPASIRLCLRDAGWSVMNADGGASGALLGVFFLGMSEGVPIDTITLDSSGLVSAFAAGLHAVSQKTNARPGDKTMMDALVPAIDALQTADKAGRDPSNAMAAAALAAEKGADSTANLTARFGRSRFLGARTLGHRDPGAVSIALIFQGFSEGLDNSRTGE